MPEADTRVEGAQNLAQVLLEENAEIERQCIARGVAADLKLDGVPGSPVADRMGLAFSGGGIRSACVNLGMVQRLARAGMLRQVHYISAISGGGYLLGWLTAWTHRQKKLAEVECQLGNNSARCAEPRPDVPPKYERFLEPFPLRYLRSHAAYLTPRIGLASGDTLAMISVYLRNLLLNQALLAAVAMVLTLTVQMFAPSMMWGKPLSTVGIAITLVLFSGGFGVGVWFAAQALSRLGEASKTEWRFASTTCIISGMVACTQIWLLTPTWIALGYERKLTPWILGAVCVAGFLVTRAALVQSKQLGAVQESAIGRWFVPLLAWSTFAALCWAMDIGVRHWLVPNSDDAAVVGDWYVIFGLPTLLAGLALVSYFFVGVMGVAFPDARREWLARLGGYYIFWAVVIGLVMVIALRGPIWINLLRGGFGTSTWRGAALKWILPGGWLFTVGAGLLGAASSKSSGSQNGSSSKLETLVAIAPPLFLLGVLLVISWGTHGIVLKAISHDQGYAAGTDYLSSARWIPKGTSSTGNVTGDVIVQQKRAVHYKKSDSGLVAVVTPSSPDRPYVLKYALLMGFGALLVAGLLAWRLDVNEFSMHLFYRNRLVRAFLGASQVPESSRQPSAFTGFASNDDIPLEELSTRNAEHPFEGPYPIWGTTLNLTVGEDLAWQQRKGASFIYSPLFCGWDYVNYKDVPDQLQPPSIDPDAEAKNRRATRKMNRFGYRATAAGANVRGYGGDGGKPFIGTAMAASGAAVSPNSGYHTKPAVAAFLAIFNVRLGWWTGNPRNPNTWKEYAPAIWYLVAELMGETDDRGKYVYLSDGGHFENLGIYELVRRKARFIISCDADADPEFGFGDLGNAIDRCRRDFGVEIHIRAQRDISPEGGSGFRAGHYAIGEIVYPGQQVSGWLLFIKSSLTSDEPSDVLGMKAKDASFPHDTTANQFFNESNFETYRALGEHMLDRILAEYHVPDDGVGTPRDRVEKLFTGLIGRGARRREGGGGEERATF